MLQKVFLRLARAGRSRSRMIVLCAIGAIVLVAVGASPVLAQEPLTMWVDPATRAAPVNGTFTVDIVADVGTEMGSNGLGAYGFDLVYDSDYLEVVNVSDAGALSGPNSRIVPVPPAPEAPPAPIIDNPNNRTAFGAYSYPPGVENVAGPDGTVVLARVTLRAKRASSATTLNLENALLTDTQANAWAGAQVTVQSGTIPIPMVVSADYDNDGKTEIAIRRPSNGAWDILTSSSDFTSSIKKYWGNSTDVLVPADYDGDNKTDIAIRRPKNGAWYILTSSSDFTSSFKKYWGHSRDVLVPADYDGDNKTDIAIRRSKNGAWYILTSSSDFTSSIKKYWGNSTDVLVPADYDGDNKTDIAIWRPSNGAWDILTSSSDFTSSFKKYWGNSTDVLVPADYDGDNKTDIAVRRPSNGAWYILTSSSDFTSSIKKYWGNSTDVLLWK